MWSSALGLFADAASKAPHTARAHLNHGVALADLGRMEEAAAAMARAVALTPGDWAARLDLGLVLLRRGDAHQAREHLAVAAERWPGPRTYGALGAAHAAAGDDEAAALALARALDAAPEDAEVRRELNAAGVRLARAGRWAAAADAFRAVIAHGPKTGEGELNLGLALEGAGDTAAAIAAYQAAAEIPQSAAEARRRLARLLQTHQHR